MRVIPFSKKLASNNHHEIINWNVWSDVDNHGDFEKDSNWLQYEMRYCQYTFQLMREIFMRNSAYLINNIIWGRKN